MTADVLAFLAAVHAADEQAARDAMTRDTGQWIAEEAITVLPDRVSALLSDGRATTHVAEVTNEWTTAHIARHDPQSVLARVEAERALLRLHRPETHARGIMCAICAEDIEQGSDREGDWPCDTLRALAWGYRGREGFDPAWTPDGATAN